MDYAWNLQVEPEILSNMEKAVKGTVVSAFGTAVERLMVNLPIQILLLERTNPSSLVGTTTGIHILFLQIM